MTCFCAVWIHCYRRWRWAKVRNTTRLIFQFIFVYSSGSDYPEFSVFAFPASCITDLKTFTVSGRFHASHPHPNVHIQEDFCFSLFLCVTKKIVQKFICFIRLIRPWLLCVCVCVSLLQILQIWRQTRRQTLRQRMASWSASRKCGSNGMECIQNSRSFRTGDNEFYFDMLGALICFSAVVFRNSRCIWTGHFCFISKAPCLSLIADRQTDGYSIHMYLHYIHV